MTRRASPGRHDARRPTPVAGWAALDRADERDALDRTREDLMACMVAGDDALADRVDDLWGTWAFAFVPAFAGEAPARELVVCATFSLGCARRAPDVAGTRRALAHFARDFGALADRRGSWGEERKPYRR